MAQVSAMESAVLQGAQASFGILFASLGQVLVKHFDMFTKRHAKRHRLAGLAYLCWLVVGFLGLFLDLPISTLAHHIVLGILGVVLTLTAAFDFRHHERFHNKASGTLEKETTVTFSEMIEHSFYQGVNLLQIVFLHVVPLAKDCFYCRAALIVVVSAPWLFRGMFPVNSFSKNYKQISWNEYTVEILLYRIKKYQYVFYKHVLLHGLNLTMALAPTRLVEQRLFLLYWLSLNASYVFEFFFQSLVKKAYISQDQMLLWQKILMLVSSIGALSILLYVRWELAVLSFLLNIFHRGHDFVNTMVLFLLASLANL